MSEEVAGETPISGVEDEPESTTRRRLITLGGAAAGAVAVAGLGAGSARADDCDGLDVIKNAPVNVKLPDFLVGDPQDPDDMGAALEAAVAYADTEGFGVVLAPTGTYLVSQLEIPAGMHLTGEGPATVLTSADPDATAVRLTGPGATLSDLRIEGDQSGTITGDPEGAVSIEAARCVVRRVEVADARKAGIMLNGQAEAARISGCRIENPASEGILGFLDEEEGEVTGVAIDGNDILVEASDVAGLAFKRAEDEDESSWSGLRISGNSITLPDTSAQAAIALGDDGQLGSVVRAAISANTIAYGIVGVLLTDAYHVSVVGNTVSGAYGYGIGAQLANTEPSGFDVIVGNTIEGRSDMISEGGVIVTSGESAIGMVVTGNSVTGCRSGIVVYGNGTGTITGNFIEATTQSGAYNLGASTEDDTGWAGISIKPLGGSSGEWAVSGNQVDGKEVLPIGIKLHNSGSVAANGNLVRDCLPGGAEGSRDLLVRVTDENLVDEGLETDGAIVANQAHVHISSEYGGAVGDLRVSANRQAVLPVVDAATDLLLPGLPEIVSVEGTPSTSIENVFHFNAGSSPTAKCYPGRRVTLRFTGVFTVVDGGNLKLNGNFTTANGSTLVLVSDGTDWYEVSRQA